MTLDYTEVPEHQVAPWRREAAARALQIVQEDLHLDGVEVVWIRSADGSLPGFVRAVFPDLIYLSCTLSEAEIYKVVSHECFHLHQIHQGLSYTGPNAEWAAGFYATSFVERHQGRLESGP